MADRPLIMRRAPSDEAVRQFISGQQERPFTYAAVGATQTTTPPQGYTVDHNRCLLGHGESTYARAVSALRSWKQFDLGWVRLRPAEPEIAVGTVVAIQANSLGLWFLNACRIVYVMEETGGLKARFGFAYGTLPAHVETGEERFSVEWQEDDSVWYDLYAFSRPRFLMVRAGYPYARRLQKRFARESLAAMAEAVR